MTAATYCAKKKGKFFFLGIIITLQRSRAKSADYRLTVIFRRTAIRSESGGCVLNRLENT
jgi:hypothetical protein